MPITKNSGRQWPIVSRTVFNWDDLVDAATEVAMDIPAGATVVGGGVNVTTAWNSVTSDVLDVGRTGDTNRFTTGGAVDLQVVGFTALDGLGDRFTTLGTIDVIATGVGGSLSAGVAELVVEYILDDRAHEVMPVQA